MSPTSVVVLCLAVVVAGLAAYAWRWRTGRWPWRALVGVGLGLAAGAVALVVGRRQTRQPIPIVPDLEDVGRRVDVALEARDTAHEVRTAADAHPEAPRAGRLGAALRRGTKNEPPGRRP